MDTMMEQYIETMTNILTPVMERATILAAEYSKACGRDVLLPEDIDYAMKYCAMHTIGDKIGSYFPEIYDSDGSDIDDIEIVDEEDEDAFEPYQGSNVAMKAITEAYDAWESWVPTNPSERMVKNAIDSNEHLA